MTRRVLIVVARLALAAVFLWAAIAKLREPWLLFAANIDSLQLLPEPMVLFVARTLPWAELALGVLLLVGLKLRYVAAAATGLLVTFFGVVLRSYILDVGGDCGCFGPGEALGPATIARDAALLGVSVWLTWESFRAERPNSPARLRSGFFAA